MKLVICETKADLGRQAAAEGAGVIREAIVARGAANIVLATGASQFEVLAELVCAEGIDWGRVTAFHLDEYAGLPASHPASFCRYLQERFAARLPGPLAAFHFIDGRADPEEECRRLAALIARLPVDAAFIGIGENGHLAFNDPPADFTAAAAYLVVTLDEACRRQQVGEGWFAALAEVPRRAISMSIPQIVKSRRIICCAPERRKAEAVRDAVEGPVTPLAPASILQRHPQTTLYLDRQSAALLGGIVPQ